MAGAYVSKAEQRKIAARKKKDAAARAANRKSAAAAKPYKAKRPINTGPAKKKVAKKSPAKRGNLFQAVRHMKNRARGI